MIIVDPDRKMTVSYMMNVMDPGLVGCPRSEALIRAPYAALA